MSKEPAVTLTPDAGSAPDLDSTRILLLRDLLHRFGQARLRVHGTSMLPSLWPGDAIEVRRIDEFMHLRPGDVLLLQRDQRLYCHRLLRWVERDGARLLCTRGDHLSSEDPLFHPECLLGRVQMPYRSTLVLVVAPLLRAIAGISQRSVAWLVRARAARRLEA